MANILCFIEIRDGRIKKSSLEAVSEACRQGEKNGLGVSALLVGNPVSGLADEVARYGAAVVYTADHPDLELYSPEGYAHAVIKACEADSSAAIFFSATSMGKDLSGRVAAKLKTAAASDCTGISLEGTWKVIRPLYAGKTFGTFTFSDGAFPVLSLRPNLFPAEEKPCDSETRPLELGDFTIRAKTVRLEKPEGAEMDVSEASVIVSGGRGMKGPENFPMLKELAHLLGGALGASRAAVDADWIDHQHQVGQTGKTVSPDLYIACGISGAIQHLAGMSSSKIIVAINKDADAPIFQIADYGIVADLFQVVPELTKEISKLKES